MKTNLYLFLIFTILLSACTDSFDVELKNNFVRLVVQGSINNERKAHQVSLTKSADYFSNTAAPKVTDAVVTISDGENTFILHEVSDGLYETDTLAGEVGKTYTLTIDSEGETYEASCYLNYCPPIDSINFGFYDLSDYGVKDNSAYVLLSALEPETPGNFYMWNVYQNDVLETDTINEVYFADDEFINGAYMSDVEVGWVRKVYIGNTIRLEMLAITEEYYKYITQLLSVTDWNAGAFGGPPANPNGNIFEVNNNNNNNDDPLGFFLAYSTYSIIDTIPEKDEWIELFWY